VLRVTTAEQPHLLVFDDAQWIDPTSFEMIEQFARNLARAPMLMVLATTPEPAPPKLASYGSHRTRYPRARFAGQVDHDAIPV